MVERDIDLYDAYTADEVFLTSTSLCLCPVSKVNHAVIGNGQVPGPVAKRLLASLLGDGRLRYRGAVPVASRLRLKRQRRGRGLAARCSYFTSVQLSAKARAEVENGRPSRWRGHDLP